MAGKVLVLTGSPRRDGNSDMLAAAFITGARSAGHEVVRFDAGRAHIEGCRACDKCFSQGKACVFDDDFNAFAEMLADVETLIFVTPMYYYSWPAQIKAALDKTYSFLIGRKPLAVRQSMLITCGEDKDPSTFAGLVKSYEIASGYCGWTDLGHLVVNGVWEKGTVADTDGLERAEKAGRELAADHGPLA